MKDNPATHNQYRWIIVLGVIVLIGGLFVAPGRAAGRHYEIGVLVDRSPEETVSQWAPVAWYLSERVPGASFSIVPLSYQDVRSGLAQDSISFVVANPAVCIQLGYFYGARQILSIQAIHDHQPLGGYGSVIFARSDRADIVGLRDLKGKRIAAVAPMSMGGWLWAIPEIRAAGIDVFEDLETVVFENSHDRVVAEVVNGNGDVGIVRSGIIEAMVREGRVRIDEIKVLQGETPFNADRGYPFLRSTPSLAPEWSLLMMPQVSEEVTREVVRALLSNPPIDTARVEWTVPLNYSSVRALLNEVLSHERGIDEALSVQDVMRFVREYWAGVVIFFAVMIFLAVSLIRRTRLNRQLRMYQKKLEEDLDKYRKSEEALRESRQLLQLVLDTLPSRVFWKDCHSAFLGCNKSLAQDCGYERPEDIIGKTDYEMPWSREESDHYVADDRRVMEIGQPLFNIIESQRRADGSLSWLRTNKAPLRGPNGEIIGILGSYEDITEQRKADEALKASETKYRELVEYANSIILRIQVDGTVTFFNEFAQSFFGFSQDEMVGKNIIGRIVADDVLGREELANIIRTMEDHPEAYSWHESENRKKDGAAVWVSWSNRGIFGEDGSLHEVLCVGTDVTERRAMEKDLRRLSYALEQSQNVVIITDTNGNIEFVNPKFVEVTGYTEQEAQGKNPRFLKSGRMSAATYQELWDTIAQGGTWRGELYNRRKDGSLYWERATISAVRDRFGKVMSYLAIKEDITEQKRLFQDLQQAFDRLKEMERIINLSHAILFLWRPQADWPIDFVSGNVTALGYAPEDFYRREYTLRSIIYPDDLATFKAEVEHQWAKREQEFSHQYRVRTRSGDVRWMEEYTWVTYDKKGQPQNCQGVAFDITDRRLAEDRMLEAVNIKSEFISIVSHELRTPLTAIKEGINIVAEEEAGELNPKQKEFLNIARRNVDRLGKLINDVLDYQRLDSGRLEFNWDEGDLRAAIMEVVNTMRIVAMNKGLDLRVHLPGELPRVRFDSNRIIQVLNNLVNNALKFTERGMIEIEARQEEGWMCVSVKDTGIGIRSEDMHKLFQTFSQILTGSDRRTGDTGLGLAISKKIIDRHGGRIWVQSMYGEGSIFSFALPVVKAHPEGL